MVAEVFEVLEEEFVVAVAVVVVDFSEELVTAEEVTVVEVEDVAEETVSDKSEEVSEREDFSVELVSVDG